VLVAGFAAFYAYRYFSALPVTRFNAAYDTTRAKLNTGYFNYDDVVGSFRSMIGNAPNNLLGARAKLQLAAVLFARNGTGDRAEAVRMLKEMVRDESLPPFYRALAAASMADFFALTADFEPMKAIAFADEPYAGFLRDAKGDAALAARRIFEYANEIQPTALAKLEIAMIDASRLMNNLPVPGMSREEAAQQIQRYVRESSEEISSLTDDLSRGRIFIYSPVQRSLFYMLSAISLGVSERILHNVGYKDIENLFQKAIALGDQYQNQRMVVLQADIARLYYAASLWSRFGDARFDNAKELLQPVYGRTLDAEVDNVHIEFLRNAGRQPGTFLHGRLAEVAQKVPALKTFLNKYGWQL